MKTKSIIMLTAAGIVAVAAIAVTYMMTKSTIPATVQAVQNFDAERYLGIWHEIARFDFKFEKNLSSVTAEYSMNPDGSIKVFNKGYNTVKRKWESATGRAIFVKSPNIGMLKVSFFGPFYAGYNVIAIDKDYKYALVVGKNMDYMWLLSRETSMPENIITEYLKIAAEAGFDLSRLIWTK